MSKKCNNTHCTNVIDVYKNINHELSTKMTEMKAKITQYMRENNELNKQLLQERQEKEHLKVELIQCLTNASGNLLHMQQVLCGPTYDFRSPLLSSSRLSQAKPRAAAQSIGKVQPIVKVPGGHIQSLSVSLSRLAPVESIDIINRELEPTFEASSTTEEIMSPPLRSNTRRNTTRSQRFSSTRFSSPSNNDSSLTDFDFDDTLTGENGPHNGVEPGDTAQPPAVDEEDTRRSQSRRTSENMAVLQTIIEETASHLSSMSGTIAGCSVAAANKENTINTSLGPFNMSFFQSATVCSTPHNNRRSQMIRSLDVRVVLSPLKVEEISKYKRKASGNDNESEDGESSDWSTTTATNSASSAPKKRRGKTTVIVKRRSTGRPKRSAAPKEMAEVSLKAKLRRPKRSR